MNLRKLDGYPTYAVVLTHNRHDWANALVDVLVEDGVVPFVIDNRSEPPFLPRNTDVVCVRDEEPLNVSRLWNYGLRSVERHAQNEGYTSWNVAVLNDDLEMPPGTLRELGFALRAYDADIAFPDVHGMQQYAKLHRHAGRLEPISLFERVSGFCFVLAGEHGLRADEEFVFWYGDDDIDWRARAGRGTVQVPLRYPIKHLDADGTYTRDPAMAEQANRDREYFVRKHGIPPW